MFSVIGIFTSETQISRLAFVVFKFCESAQVSDRLGIVVVTFIFAPSVSVFFLFTIIHRIKRSYYEGGISEPVKDIRSLTERELTCRYIRNPEAVIREYPEMWLWSHRRWKHKWRK